MAPHGKATYGTPQTHFHVFGHRFRTEIALDANGANVEISEPELSFIINETKGSATYTYAWFPITTMHAIDWALLHNTNTIVETFGRYAAPPLPISLVNPIRVSQFAPLDNRTVMGIEQQKSENLFSVRINITSKDFKNPIEFLVQYNGRAPKNFIGATVQGSLTGTGSGQKYYPFKEAN